MTEKTSNAMWGGRFASGPDAIMEAINASIGFDRRLAAQDVEGSRAHAAMLATQGIITDSDAAAIRKGLDTILSEIAEDRFEFRTDLEDIHMTVEARHLGLKPRARIGHSEVHGDGRGAHIVAGGKIAGQQAELRFGAGHEDQIIAIRREAFGKRLADPAGRTGDQSRKTAAAASSCHSAASLSGAMERT